MDNTTRIYFKGLNGLRFFAALAVIITHIELIKQQLKFPNYYNSNNKMILELGELGVIFFFVLSGFLITFLLLKEKERTGDINVRKFYLRRILRIWPLYFFIVFLGFFVLPYLQSMEIPYFIKFKGHLSILNLLLFVCMLPNLAFAIFKPLPHIGQSWSIGVEEQFYLIWPYIVKKSTKILKTLFIIILILLLIKVILVFILKIYPTNSYLLIVKQFIAMLKFESMAIGGIGAWMVYTGNFYKHILKNYILIGSIFSIPLLVYFMPHIIQDASFILYSILFLMIILNVSLNNSSIIKLENKVFIFLGNISYGLYMYHFMVVAACISLINKAGFDVGNSLTSQFIVYIGVILISILIASVSYLYFESWFLKLKNKFTVIQSGSELPSSLKEKR